MASRRLTDLARPVYERAERFLCACEAAGISVLIYCTYRPTVEQAALYAQGREPLDVVNRMRAAANLPPITEKQNRTTCTNSKPGEGAHEFRVAFDCVVMQAGKPIWDGSAPIWDQVGAIGESCGLEWSKRWKVRQGMIKEVGHFQYTGGLTLAQIQAGIVPK